MEGQIQELERNYESLRLSPYLSLDEKGVQERVVDTSFYLSTAVGVVVLLIINFNLMISLGGNIVEYASNEIGNHQGN